MRLLVTGGAGFIGSNFIRYWLSQHSDDAILNYDLLTYAGDTMSLEDVVARFGTRYRFVRGDILDHRTVEASFRQFRPDAIVNFAAESHNSRAVMDPLRFTRTNVLGTQTLLEAARAADIPRFHHVSTCEVYGDLPLDTDERFTEESPYRSRTPYNSSKAASELIVRAYHQTYSVGVTISNCSNNYGPWQHPEKVIPLFVTNALSDLPRPIYQHSQNRREWLHVDDHCRALDLVISNGANGEVYNVGSGEERTVEQLADAILGMLGKPLTLKTYVPDRPGHDRRYTLDHSKITNRLGWRPLVPFDAGLEATVQWYVRNRSWWLPKRRESEVNEFQWSSERRARAVSRT